jgi:hypothetical protein
VPTFQAKLADARTKRAQWTREHVDTFHTHFSDGKALVKAFEGRESLLKNGTKFPIGTTTVEELWIALDAIDRGDFSVYTRKAQDSTRHLIIVEQPIYDIADIRDGMNLSDALCYDAAVFNTMGHHYERADSFCGIYRGLAMECPEDSEESAESLLEEQKRLGESIRTIIANEIIKLEWQKTYNRIVEDPTIPELYKTKDILALESVSTPLRLRQAIDDLNRKYQQIIADIQQQIVNYEEAKAGLRAFLAPESSARCPTNLKAKGQSLFTTLEAAEERQARSLLAIESIRMIYEYLAETKHEITQITTACHEAKKLFLATLNNGDIDDSLKLQGRLLLTRYLEEESSLNPLDKLQDLAKRLEQERLTIIEWHKLSSPYKGVVEQLQTVVRNPRTPVDFKMSATRLLEAPFFTLSLSEAKMRVVALTQECKSIERQLSEYQTKCDYAKTSLKTFLDTTPQCPMAIKSEGVDLLRRLEVADTTQAASSVSLELINRVMVYQTRALDEIEKIKQHCRLAKQILMTALEISTIDDSDKAQGRRLLAAFTAEEDTKNPLDTLLALSASLKTEGIKLESQSRDKARAALQALVNDAKIPSGFKKTAQGILGTEKELADALKIRGETQNLQSTHTEMTRAVLAFNQSCEAAKTELTTLLASEIPGEILAKGRTLIASYEAATTGDALLKLLPRLREESETIIKLHELYKKYGIAKTELQSKINDGYIPGSLKSDAATLITKAYHADDEASATFLVRCLNNAITNIAREVKRIESECFANKGILELSLARLEIHPSLKGQGRALVAAYIAARDNGSTLDNLVRLAAGLKTENATIQANHKIRQGYVGEKTVFKTLLDNPEIDTSLKEEGRRLLRQFNTVESNAASTLEELRIAAAALTVERKKIQDSHAIRRLYHDVYSKIAVMKAYGQGLLTDDHIKGTAVVALSEALKAKADTFVMSYRERPLDIATFESEFTHLLHSQDAAMNHHRHQWKPIVANILLALTVVGLIAIMIKAGLQAIHPKGNADDPNRTFNHSLFFAKTRTQEKLESIEADVINRRLIV